MLAGKKIEGPVWKVFLHPAILAALTTLILYLCRIELPAFITGTADMVGAITTPASMLVLGATLAGSPLKAVFSNWRLYVFCGITLIAMPLATYAMLLPFTDEVMILGVTTIMAALPGAASSAMQCHEYGGDADVCSAGVFLSTLCSLATIPLLMLMLFAH